MTKKDTQFKTGHAQSNTGRTHFKKGIIPWNKDMKGMMIAWNKGKSVRLNPATEFKKGNKPWNKGKGIEMPKCGVCEINLKNRYAKTCQRHRKNWDKERERQLYAARKRRAIQMKAEGSHTLAEWLNCKAGHAYLCAICGDIEPNIKLTADHIIPLSKGGTNYITNIQPLCRSCNSRKGNRLVTSPKNK